MPEDFIRYDPVNYIRDKEDVQLFLAAGLEGSEGDVRPLKSTLHHIARALTEKHIENDFGISGKDIVNALSDDPGLSFETVSRIAQGLGMKLTATKAEPPPEEICYRSISKEEAQGEILELLAVEPDLCYDDISDRLRIEMEMVVDICIETGRQGSYQGRRLGTISNPAAAFPAASLRCLFTPTLTLPLRGRGLFGGCLAAHLDPPTEGEGTF